MTEALNTALLGRLLQTPGVSGREQGVREVIRAELTELSFDSRVDKLGSLIGHRDGTGAKVMLCAHMDTIGFLVQHIDDDGFIRVMAVGGIDPRTLVHQRVKVCGKEDLMGIISPAQPPIHLTDKEDRKKTPKIEDLFIDVMLPADEVKKLVEVGDQIVIHREPQFTERTVLSPYLDNRLGIYITLEALRRADTQADIYPVFSVLEEVNLRGSGAGAFGIEPDMGVVIDTAIAADLPGSNPRSGKINCLGDGAILTVMDSRTISDPRLITHLRSLAESNNIPYGLEALDCGGTDAGGIQPSRAGVPVVALGPATRYVHTCSETALISDIEATIDLLVRFLEGVHELELSW